MYIYFDLHPDDVATVSSTNDLQSTHRDTDGDDGSEHLSSGLKVFLFSALVAFVTGMVVVMKRE